MAKTRNVQISYVEYECSSITLDSSKDKVKYIKQIERLVRGSDEYKDYVKFLKDYVDMTTCLFFKKVDSSNRGIKIEIHHEPLGLYDITNIVLHKWLYEGLPLNDLLIADEVNELHYRNMVGLTPLSISVHKVITKSDKLTIPLFMVYGNYPKIFAEYGEYLDECEELAYITEKVQRKITATKLLTTESFDILKPEFTYLEVEGVPVLEDLKIVDEANDTKQTVA